MPRDSASTAPCISNKLPAGGRNIAIKNGEYQLRLNSPKEGGCFAFFVNLDGWEPRVCSEQRVVPGQWYRLTAGWDGFALTLDVNGQRSRVTRSGLGEATDNPLVIGGLGGLIDNLKIENPRLPTLQVRDARQEHAILLAGRPEKLTTTIRNVGTATEQVVVRFKLPPGTRCLGQAIHELGAMPTGAERTIEWSVEADAAIIGAAEIQVTAAGVPARDGAASVGVLPERGWPAGFGLGKTAATAAGDGKAATYYIDSVAGNNANAGTSPDAAWKDFTNVNGRVLGPGERLLLRRGSVFNQELNVSARGTEDNWAEIGAYGDGARPIIRRNWDIDDRCALVRNPDFLRIRSLVVCYAAKGLIVSYTESGHRGLVIEDCIAHHIEGLYRFNSHGIPEWRDRQGPAGDGVNNSAGIAITGATATDLVLRDCEMFQCSSGYFVRGDDVIIDRVFCHDNIVHNTSPHPFVVDVRRAVLRNSIFDASGWHASAGTMGIMLGDPQGLIIRNCYFRNQPDSGSHDEGGIDFENRGQRLPDRSLHLRKQRRGGDRGAGTEVAPNHEHRDPQFAIHPEQHRQETGTVGNLHLGASPRPVRLLQHGHRPGQRLCAPARRRVLRQRGPQADVLDAARQHPVCNRRGDRPRDALQPPAGGRRRARHSHRPAKVALAGRVQRRRPTRRANRCRSPGKCSRGPAASRSTTPMLPPPRPPSTSRATTCCVWWPTTASFGSATWSWCTFFPRARRSSRPGNSTRTWTRKGGPR